MFKWILFPLLLLTFGCGAQTRTYSVRVRNQTPQAITIGLAKEGGPYEEVWASPEELRNHGKPGENWGLAVVPPGGGATARDVKGQFANGSKAWLRVYRGDLTLGEMMRIKDDSPDRLDVPLKPGGNEIAVSNRDGRMVSASTQP